VESDAGTEVRLNDVLIDRFGPGESAGYPVICKGRFTVNKATYHALEEPTSLNTLELLPALARAGVAAVKIEGRQRSVAYVDKAVRVWREALDSCRRDPAAYRPRCEWMNALAGLSEGAQTTLGAYDRPWQ